MKVQHIIKVIRASDIKHLKNIQTIINISDDLTEEQKDKILAEIDNCELKLRNATK